MQQDRHVQAYNVVNHACDLLKNDETALINISAMWAWGAQPVFSEG